jgi:hypothetical protein
MRDPCVGCNLQCFKELDARSGRAIPEPGPGRTTGGPIPLLFACQFAPALGGGFARLIGCLALAALAAGVGYFLLAPATPAGSLIVLPIEAPSGDPELQSLADALTNGIITDAALSSRIKFAAGSGRPGGGGRPARRGRPAARRGRGADR